VVILIGLGANLPSPRYGDPLDTCEAALEALSRAGIRVRARSRWYRSAPVPPSDQPWFVNGVAEVETELDPVGLLALLHRIEEDFGRARRTRNEPRILDLDLLAYGDRVSAPGEEPALPHPRMAERAFVVLPLADLAPGWRHPVSGLTAAELAARLPSGQTAEPLE
jgi:2-amino-4-hydroxy-6-hydroxymethyldihydropteridine diphosphokinase